MSAPQRLTGDELAAICRRSLDAATDEDAYFTRLGVLTEDVPRLVAEVESLRVEIERLRRSKFCGCGWCCSTVAPGTAGEAHLRVCPAQQVLP